MSQQEMNKLDRLESALEEIADPVQYLSLHLNLRNSGMTMQEWAKAVLNNSLAWSKGKMVIAK